MPSPQEIFKPATSAAEHARSLTEHTFLGHGTNGATFAWEPQAAIFDQAQANGTLAHLSAANLQQMRTQLEAEAPGSWTFSMQVAEPAPIPQGFDTKKVGETQGTLLEAVQHLPCLALQNGHTLLQGLIEYGLSTDPSSQALRAILYRSAPPVKSFRLDTVAGHITEAQVAMGSVASAMRIPQGNDQIGGNCEFGHHLVDAARTASGKSSPTIALAVEAGVSIYLPAFNDARIPLAEIAPDCPVFVVGNGGFRYDGHHLYYVNSHSQAQHPLDFVYLLPDARRLLKPDMLPLLEAVRDHAVAIQPTLNTLLNNYHLLRALMFHQDANITDILSAAIALEGVNPQEFLAAARAQTIPMSLVDTHNSLDPTLLGLTSLPETGWDEVIAYMRTRKQSVFSKAQQKQLYLRFLLTPDLSRLSGGFGLQRLDNFSTSELTCLLENSATGMHQLRTKGFTSHTIVGIEPAILQPGLPVTAYEYQHGHVEKIAIPDALQRFSPVYCQDATGQPQLTSALSWYSGRNGHHVKLGGKYYAIGAHI